MKISGLKTSAIKHTKFFISDFFSYKMSKKGIIEKDIVIYSSIRRKVIASLFIVLIIFNIINVYVITTTFYFKKITGYGSDTGSISLSIEEWRVVEINSPLNQTYNAVLLTDYYPLELNVSSNFNNDIHAWWYTLVDLANNVTLNESVIFTPNTTIYTVRYSNQLTVFANRSGNFTYNDSVVFYINVANSAPKIQNLTRDMLSCELGVLSEVFNVSDSDGDAISVSLNPQSPSNPFFIQSLYNINATLSVHEIFSGTLDKSDAGGIFMGNKTYAVNVSASDSYNSSCCSDTVSANITVIEINNIPVIENIATKTIWSQGDNSTLYIQTIVSDVESGDHDDGNMSFNITIKNSTGINVSLFNISALGVINFTANSSYVGVYNVTICVSDQSLISPHQNISLCSNNGTNQSDCETFGLTVTNQNRAPEILTHYPNESNFIANEGETSSFNVSSRDPDGTIPDNYWYVDGSLEKFEEASYNSTFQHSWGFNDAGYHNVTIIVTDGLLQDSFTWNVTIIDVPQPAGAPSAGGGGGGGGGTVCSSKWGCAEWSQCSNLSFLEESRNITAIKESCKQRGINETYCGYQTRICQDINKCSFPTNEPLSVQYCYYIIEPSCSDGIKNCHNGACEVLADCGGPCEVCPSCSDNIKNQGEEGVDCGGPCDACREIPLVKVVSNRIFYFFISLLLLLIAIILFIRYEIHRYKVSKMLREKKEKLNRLKFSVT